MSSESQPGAVGRPVVRSPYYQKRYDKWCDWWQNRPGGRPSAAELARRMEAKESTVRAAANKGRPPSETMLCNLESLSAAYGFEPATDEYRVL